MMAENNIHTPIPTSFFHATAIVALTPQPIATLMTTSFSMYTSILKCPVACTNPSTYMYNDKVYSWLTAQSKGGGGERGEVGWKGKPFQ